VPYKDPLKRREVEKRYREKNKEKARAWARDYWHRKGKYKLRQVKPQFYFKLLEQQNNLCAICLQPERAIGRNGKVKALSLDHNHITGEVRGLLCSTCNLLLGYAGDSPEILERAKEYLGSQTGYMVKTYRGKSKRLSTFL
jgi:hypothetical protein